MSGSLSKVIRVAGGVMAVSSVVLTALPAFAGFSVPVALGTDVGGALPFAAGGLLALLAGAVIGGIYLVRRKS